MPDADSIPLDYILDSRKRTRSGAHKFHKDSPWCRCAVDYGDALMCRRCGQMLGPPEARLGKVPSAEHERQQHEAWLKMWRESEIANLPATRRFRLGG